MRCYRRLPTYTIQEFHKVQLNNSENLNTHNAEKTNKKSIHNKF